MKKLKIVKFGFRGVRKISAGFDILHDIANKNHFWGGGLKLHFGGTLSGRIGVLRQVCSI